MTGSDKNEENWHCEDCSTLLGIRTGTSLSIRYKDAQYIIDGEMSKVTAVCRKCSKINRIEITEGNRPEAA
ncbi:MAG: hypothetical protein GY839_10830 [candidate division Zixibacteria bacterium]|nr:hypothetical protein [candidate division Zixibacteria bacterium]